jgi:dynein light intermediate chain 1, cytosolic
LIDWLVGWLVVQPIDVLGRLNVWQLEGEQQHMDLLSFAINASNIERSVVVIALDLSEPWTLEKRLQMWLSCVREHIQSLRLPSAVLQSLREASMVNGYQPEQPEQQQQALIQSM